MKKSEKNKKSSQPKKVNRKESLQDMGLEPPKIYRESQKNIVSRQERARKSTVRGKKNQNMTRAEKRQVDNKKRKKKNKIRKFLIGVAAVIIVVSIGVFLSLTSFFHIDDITVTGNERYSVEEILNQCTIKTGENLFMADTEAAKEQIEFNLPYIYNAEIKRKLPYTIEITVTETEPVYSIKNKDKTYILLDDRFKVLEDAAEKSSGINISKAEIKSAVLGKTIEFKDENVGKCLSDMAKVIRDNKFTEITSIYSNNINDNYAVYDNRITFKLGSCKDIENKIFKGMASCEKLDETSPNVTGTMDISGGKSIYFTEN